MVADTLSGMAVDIGEMLDRLLTEGAHRFDDAHDCRMTMIPLGEVTVPTGRIVACDPLIHPGETPPFTVTAPPGRYPLRAWVAVVHPAGSMLAADPPATAPGPATTRPGGNDAGGAGRLAGLPIEADRRTAALQLVVRDEPVATWEPAVPAGPGPSILDEDGFATYPADSGTGALADERALAGLRTWSYARVEQTYLPEPGPPALSALDAVTDPATGANVVAVATGDGDGGYATFIGRTASGKVATFVTDFRVI
ncbi:uncharacterized protein DUF4241 [Pseudosporangium ferrugineum]|uniref:Uncharacterized protein DUF4241 n=2 Tax=Pseudosporangium ferrugineum TaxID=439699 RepID=A0A2T0S2I7_9ACTN|nr:uncharacterized protein DUF4241 [Pseudosporangium ferrugineum]